MAITVNKEAQSFVNLKSIISITLNITKLLCWRTNINLPLALELVAQQKLFNYFDEIESIICVNLRFFIQLGSKIEFVFLEIMGFFV